MILICFDYHHELSETIKDITIQLDRIHDHLIFHTELQSCIVSIESNEQNQIFLITINSSRRMKSFNI